MLGRLASSTLQYARSSTYGVSKYLGGGFGGLGKLGIGAIGVGMTMATDGREYGMGYGAAKGLAYMVPYLGGAMMAYDLSKAALEYGNDVYHSRRKLEMFSPVPDLYGNTATMRQRSLQNLDRGRAILGSEAQLLR